MFAPQLDGIHGMPGKHALCTRAVDTDAEKAGTEAVDGAASTAPDANGGVLQNVGSTVMDFGSEVTKSVEEIMKAGSRPNLAVLDLLGTLFNAVSLSVAKGSEYLASGTNMVDGMLNGVPVMGVITGGVNNIATGLSSAVNEISATGRQSRKKFFDQLREKLNNSNGAAAADPATANTAADTATTNTATSKPAVSASV